MKTLLLAALLVSVASGGALASDHKGKASEFTTIDPCALKGRGFEIGETGTCLKITGGVSYWQSWGNSTGGDGEPGGLTIVNTPAGAYTIPAPR